jgi:hypothetical protein
MGADVTTVLRPSDAGGGRIVCTGVNLWNGASCSMLFRMIPAVGFPGGSFVTSVPLRPNPNVTVPGVPFKSGLSGWKVTMSRRFANALPPARSPRLPWTSRWSWRSIPGGRSPLQRGPRR